MKRIYKIIALAVTLVMATTAMTLSAKDNGPLLPSSTKSEAAKEAFMKAIDRLQNGDFDHYSEWMDKALSEDPQFFMAHAQLALSSAALNQDKGSNSHLESALALPQDKFTPAEQIIRRMLITVRDDKKEEMKLLCNELVKAYPETEHAFELASAMSNFILDDPQAYNMYALRLVEMNPTHASYYNNLGYSYIKTGEMDKAKEAFDNYVRLAPKEPNAYDSMGEYYKMMGEYEKSAASYDRAFALGMKESRERADEVRNLAKGAEEETEKDK
ncbi:MAG TPA: tetratricopeptide repeat protein [Chitinophagaceae bacterium]|nr:tetratricopeptide repeat protein [Chitinophagaceae bacterium]